MRSTDLAGRIRRTALLILFWLAGQLAHLVASAWMLLAAIANPWGDRAWHIAIAWDQLFNATTGGDEDETLSSRAGRAARRGERWGCVLCRVLEWFDPGHCERSIENPAARTDGD